MKDKQALGSGPYRLWPKMTQPEGVTVDTEGNIYVVGEPNQFMVLRRKTLLSILNIKKGGSPPSSVFQFTGFTLHRLMLKHYRLCRSSWYGSIHREAYPVVHRCGHQNNPAGPAINWPVSVHCDNHHRKIMHC